MIGCQASGSHYSIHAIDVRQAAQKLLESLQYCNAKTTILFVSPKSVLDF